MIVAVDPVDRPGKGSAVLIRLDFETNSHCYKNTINTYILILFAQKIAERSIPTGSPKDTAVFDLTQLGTLLGIGSEDAHDYILTHIAGTQADVLTGVLLAQATKH